MTMPSRFLIGAAVVFFTVATGIAATPAKPDPRQIEQFTRLQIFLDNANFGPGKIDGHDGAFTRKALALFRKAQGLSPAAPANARAPIDFSSLDLTSVDPVFIEYAVTKEDIASVGTLPSGPEAQAKVKWLPYRSVGEALAEKFHSDLNFVKKLNPGKAEHLKEGDKVKVPNVKPFELSLVKTMKPGSEVERVIANELGDTPDESAPSKPATAPDPQLLAVHISTKESMLEIRSGEKLIAAFPVTVGSHQTVSPIGKWVVKGIAKLPTFRYDPMMLKKGERSSNFHLLPPGPRNPVGVLWIALNKKGIGIHGTNDPDSIGRSASHGCIRLANWDAVKVAELVKTGMPVTIEEYTSAFRVFRGQTHFAF